MILLHLVQDGELFFETTMEEFIESDCHRWESLEEAMGYFSRIHPMNGVINVVNSNLVEFYNDPIDQSDLLSIKESILRVRKRKSDSLVDSVVEKL